MIAKKNVLVTGGTGGMGLATALKLSQNGFHVFVADNNAAMIKNVELTDGITPLLMDVTDRKSIERAFNEIKSQTDSLAGVVNFAGILRVGSISEMPEETLSLLLDINVMGTYRVNQIFLPLLNRNIKGRIINISSETGWQSGGPFNGAYAMSKHAIEAYSDSLRRELMFLGIDVVKIQPGPFKTEMVAGIEGNFNKAIENTQHFTKQITRVKELALNEQTKAHSPNIIASTVLKALTCKKPKAAYSVKADLARTLLEIFPTSFADFLLKKVIGQ